MTQLLVVILCFALAGCGPGWKKKFVRKKTPVVPEKVFVYEPQDYQSEPNAEIYKRSFIFWRAWQEELVFRLGQNRSGDLRAFTEALKNIDEMKACLTEQKAVELEDYKKRLDTLYTYYKSANLDIVRTNQMRQDLDRLMLKIDKIFRYSRAKDCIK